MAIDYTVKKQTNNQLNIDYRTRILFLRDNKYKAGEVNNAGYDDLELKAGTIMGRISGTGLLTPLKSGASDGSQYPVGILATDYTVVSGETKEVQICNDGEVAQEHIVFDGSDDLDTVIDGRTLGDRIAGDTAGVILVPTDELSEYDN